MAMKVQVNLLVEAVDAKSSAIRIKKIRALTDETWFGFSKELQEISLHPELFGLPAMKTAKSSLKARGQFRNIKLELPEDVAKVYIDDCGNFIFKDYMLSELLEENKSDKHDSTDMNSLIGALTKISDKKESVNKIVKHFLIEKFSAKNRNVKAWTDQFEKECNRFDIIGTDQIEAFRLCLDQSMLDWFLNMQKKIGIDSEWESWKTDLLETFTDLTFKPVNYAYNFRYFSGPFIDFIVKKERLLMDLDPDIPEKFKLNLIVLGLPPKIQGELTRNTITSVKLLINKIKKFENQAKRSENRNVDNRNSDTDQNKSSLSDKKKNTSFERDTGANSRDKLTQRADKKPCTICEKNNRGVRYHPESSCWFKDKVENKIPFVNNVNLESPLNDVVESKNLQ